MANIQNLKPLNTLSKEDAKKIRAKGSIARGKKIQERKTFKEILNTLLQEKSVEDSNLTNDQLINIKLIAEAVKGNVKAFETIRDTIGEKPVDKLDANIDGKLEIIMDNDIQELSK